MQGFGVGVMDYRKALEVMERAASYEGDHIETILEQCGHMLFRR